MKISCIKIKKSIVIMLVLMVGIILISCNKQVNSELTGNNRLPVDVPSAEGKLDSYDVNVSINYKVVLEDKVKEVNPNIIKAAREAIFLADCEFSKLQHYNGYKKQGIINIFEIIDQSKNSWEVRYRIKEKESDKDDARFYQSVTVEKQKEGCYKGYIVHSWPAVKGDETY